MRYTPAAWSSVVGDERGNVFRRQDGGPRRRVPLGGQREVDADTESVEVRESVGGVVERRRWGHHADVAQDPLLEAITYRVVGALGDRRVVAARD